MRFGGDINVDNFVDNLWTVVDKFQNPIGIGLINKLSTLEKAVINNRMLITALSCCSRCVVDSGSGVDNSQTDVEKWWEVDLKKSSILLIQPQCTQITESLVSCWIGCANQVRQHFSHCRILWYAGVPSEPGFRTWKLILNSGSDMVDSFRLVSKCYAKSSILDEVRIKSGWVVIWKLKPYLEVIKMRKCAWLIMYSFIMGNRCCGVTVMIKSSLQGACDQTPTAHNTHYIPDMLGADSAIHYHGYI